MNREELNLKRDELNPYHMSQENALYVGHNVGWDACAEILLPEIERLEYAVKVWKDEELTNIQAFVDNNKRITQLEKENAELKTGLGVAGEFINRNDTLTRKLEIATMALEHYQEIESRTFSKLAVATNALASIAEVK